MALSSSPPLGPPAGESQRPWVVQSLGKALAMLGGALMLVTALVSAGYAATGQPPAWVALRVVAGSVAYTAAGVLAWWRRPTNRMGQIMLLGAAVWLLSALVGVRGPVLVTVGTVTRIVPFAVVVHLLLAFPSGRLRSAPARWTIGVAYVGAVALEAPRYLFVPASGGAGDLVVADLPRLAAAGETAQVVVGSAVMVATAGILLARLRNSDRWQRRVLGPLYLYGTVAVLAVPLMPELVQPLTGLSTRAVDSVLLGLLIGTPVAFSAALLLGGFARAGEVQELSVWLSSVAGARSSLSDALARALGDRSVQLAYWVAEHETFADPAGRPVPLPTPGSGRAVAEVRVGERLVGAIIYDSTLIADPKPVQAAARVIALAVDHQRLTAALAASHRQIQLSRERIIQAGDRERHRIARDLHDGMQADLVLLSVEAQQLADGVRSPQAVAAARLLRAHIDRAAAGLRDLVYDVMPAPLIERGLAAATEDLVDRMPIPTTLMMQADGGLSVALQSTAYFVVAEALTNAVKHAHARSVTVRVTQHVDSLIVQIADDGVGGARVDDGFGLVGLADRVEVLGGTLHVDSPPGAGTRLIAELPTTGTGA